MADQTIASPQTIDTLIEKVKIYLPTVHERRLREAYAFAEKAHAGQTRMSGEPYIHHPLGVAFILTDFKADEDSVTVALLHDVVEDCNVPVSELDRLFGKEVARMVDALTKLPKVHNILGIAEHEQFDYRIESIRKIFEIMQRDIRVMVIKLCDRLHNMRSLAFFRPEKQKRISQETFDIYVKIANRLCIYEIKEALEEHCYRYLYPEPFKKIQEEKKKHDGIMSHYKKYIHEKVSLCRHLPKAKDIFFFQHIHYGDAIEQKSEPPKLEAQVFIIMSSEEDCYLALRDIHSQWITLRDQLRDYIALPRSNGFQGLKTTIIKRDGAQVRIIIQTESMYNYGRRGIANLCFSQTDDTKKNYLSWLTQLKSIQKGTKERSQDFINALEDDILKEHITIYLPENKTFFLPPHSTLLDAAFYAHGTKAQYLAQARLNGKEENFSRLLSDGDNVQYDMDVHHYLNSEWMQMVNTTFARTIISSIVQAMPQHQRIQFGHHMLQTELDKRGYGYVEEIDQKTIRNSFQHYGIQSRAELCDAIATGTIPLDAACKIIFSSKVKDNTNSDQNYFFEISLSSEKPTSVIPLLSLFEAQEQCLKRFELKRFNSSLDISGEVHFPPQQYDRMLTSIKSLNSVRSIILADKSHLKISSWLILLFMILVSFDPIMAYILLHQFQIHALDFVTVRFLSIFLILSCIIFFKKMQSGHILESPIRYRYPSFYLSTIGLFGTALFTYLSLSTTLSPFFYQISIYILFFPFITLQRSDLPKTRIRLYLAFSAVFSAALAFYAIQQHDYLPQQILSTFLVGLFFILYTHFSIQFQHQQHIHRRYLSFFRNISLYAAMLSFLPHVFRASFVLPSLTQIGTISLFSIIFIMIPYILYYILSGLHGYTADLWKIFIFIILFIKVEEIFILGIPFNVLEFGFALVLIAAYFLTVRPVRLPSHHEA